MSWYETVTSVPVLFAIAVGISAVLYILQQNPQPPEYYAQKRREAAAAAREANQAGKASAGQAATEGPKDPKAKIAESLSVMSAPAADLAPPKDDPISVAELKQFDGSDPSKPIYVAIKGKVYDVSGKKDMYGPGAGYNVFAGKDASKGLGMSSLDPKDAIADYSALNETQLKTLNQWDSFFAKRYNIVGKVVP